MTDTMYTQHSLKYYANRIDTRLQHTIKRHDRVAILRCLKVFLAPLTETSDLVVCLIFIDYKMNLV